MITIGLTGSIGMGKSATAQMFQELGLPVYDADGAVHKLYEPGGAGVAPVEEAFPGTVVDGRVDRERLSAKVMDNPKAFAQLEAIVHPLVQADRAQEIERQKQQGAQLMVFDIPLLFEKGGEDAVDYVVVVSAPYEVQRARVLERPGMSAEKFDAITAKQVPDDKKRRGADFVIETDQGFDAARERVVEIIRIIRDRHGLAPSDVV